MPNMNKVHIAVRMYYQKLLKKHLAVQSIQTGILISSGDLIAQTTVEKKRWSEIDFSRTSKFLIIGVALVGPALTVWYKFLSKVLTHGTNKIIVFKKVALDQIIFAPISTLVFMSASHILEGSTWMIIKNELSEKYKNIMVTGYAIWPFVQFINFYAVPLKYQVLVVQSVALFWNAYLCWKLNEESDHSTVYN